MHDQPGFCGAGAQAVVAHWGPHFGEEPPISGSRGSGNVFFSPCNLRCVFCQNHQISHLLTGHEVSVAGLAEIFAALERAGAHNINLVSPTPYVPLIAAAIKAARKIGVLVPFVYNTNAYETTETIRLLDGLIDVYLPDFKYWTPGVARRLSAAPDYAEHAAAAIMAMKAQVGDLVCDEGLAKRGLIVRHLVLPGGLAGTRRVMRWTKEHCGVQTYVSLMSQYYPVHEALRYPLINRTLKPGEYERLVSFMIDEGFENVFIQELDSAPVLLPDFTREEPFEKNRA